MVRVEGRYRLVWLVVGLLVAAGCGDSEGSNGSTETSGGASGSAGSSAGTSASGGTGGGSSGTGGSSSGTGGAQSGAGGTDGATPEGFRAAFIRASCENLFTCNWGSDAFAMREILGTRERCVEWYDARFGPHIELRLDAVARGVLTFDAAEARHCLDIVPQACVLWETEEPLNAFGVTCGGVFEGAVPAGGDCASNEDCAGDAFCDRDAFSEPACLGRCLGRIAPGAACMEGFQCSTGGFEDATCGSDGICATIALGAAVAEGGTCGLVPAGEHALTLIPCSGDAWCNRGQEQTGVCAPPVAMGEECPTEQAPCAGGMCSNDGPLERCLSFTLQPRAGAPCRAAEREFCNPDSGLVCTAEVCEDGAGDCTLGFSCSATQYCATDQCVQKKADGEECDVHSECASALCVQRLTNEPHRCYAPFCPDW